MSREAVSWGVESKGLARGKRSQTEQEVFWDRGSDNYLQGEKVERRDSGVSAFHHGANEAVLGGSGKLFHVPGVARAKELAEITAAALGDDVFDLLVHHVFVAWHVAPRAENPDGRWEVRAVLHVRELEGVCRTRMMRIVNDQIRLGDAVAELHDFDVAVRFPADTLVAVLAENHGLAVFELEDVLAAGFAVRQREPRAVVKDVAVLQNFPVARTFVCGRVFQRLFQVSLENVHGPGHER